jgi:hypothetical protein
MTRNRPPSKDNSLSLKNQLVVVWMRTRSTVQAARMVRGHACIERAYNVRLWVVRMAFGIDGTIARPALEIARSPRES